MHLPFGLGLSIDNLGLQHSYINAVAITSVSMITYLSNYYEDILSSTSNQLLLAIGVREENTGPQCLHLIAGVVSVPLQNGLAYFFGNSKKPRCKPPEFNRNIFFQFIVHRFLASHSSSSLYLQC